MKQCAIVRNGNDIVKVSNLKRKYNKIINNPNMQILEECDLEELEEKFAKWNIPKTEETSNVETKYYFKNAITGYTIVSIYDTLDHLEGIIENWRDYERI